MDDYEGGTRRRYQDERVARDYHADFSDPSRRNFRARKVAQWERRAVSQILDSLAPIRVLDLPAGTGKLAPVLASRGLKITAADISPQMLDIAKTEYSRLDYHDVQFVVSDAESAANIDGAPFDLVVCLRLMHRVPASARRDILAAFAEVAPIIIVSYGVPTRLHRLRRALLRVPPSGHEHVDWEVISQDVSEYFHLRRKVPVARGASLEWLLLLERRTA